jgi:hypothetical protein
MNIGDRRYSQKEFGLSNAKKREVAEVSNTCSVENATSTRKNTRVRLLALITRSAALLQRSQHLPPPPPRPDTHSNRRLRDGLRLQTSTAWETALCPLSAGDQVLGRSYRLGLHNPTPYKATFSDNKSSSLSMQCRSCGLLILWCSLFWPPLRICGQGLFRAAWFVPSSELSSQRQHAVHGPCWLANPI